MLCSA